MKLLRHFRVDIVVLVAALAVAAIYGGGTALELAAILVVVEIVFSFDNATVNAKILERMSPFWTRIFLTVGVLVAVVGMRLLFPLIIVSLTAKITPWEAVRLALEKGDVHHPGTYGYLLNQAHPSIAAFGGMFLMILALDFLLDTGRETTWLGPIERPLIRIGKLDQLSVVIAGAVLAVISVTLTSGGETRRVLFAGLLGIVAYLLVNALGNLIGPEDDDDDEEGQDVGGQRSPRRGAPVAKVAGKAAFLLFIYLEVIDASFSFDGVIGAFAITPDPIIIALGLGVGALFIRTLTVYLVQEGTLSEYQYLEHGAQWAILTLSVILLLSVRYTLPDVVTGLIGVALIAASFLTSVLENRRHDVANADATTS
ncbi:MAG: DUF475 domain-containing protein [Actinomycetota bacterium]|nr:DUF475 domain-containing protein [Actinomycetota bacterium]